MNIVSIHFKYKNMKKQSPFYKTGTSRSPFNKDKPKFIKPEKGYEYSSQGKGKIKKIKKN